jgi:hypothetical protein
MNAIYQPLYTQLLAELESTVAQAIPEPGKTEYCFRVAIHYWQRLKENMDNNPFTNDEDETGFFKNTKPLFTCHIEYCILIYPAVLFKPADTKKAMLFWENELLRFARFLNNWPEFVQYYQSGTTCLDHLYFLRENNAGNTTRSCKIYDQDPAYASSFDWLVAELLAHKMYNKYVHAQLQAIR